VTPDSTIVTVEALPVVVHGDRDFRISEGGTRTHTSVILRLLTETDGLEGNAEIVSAPPGKPEEFLDEILGAVRNYVAPALKGFNARDRTAASAAVERALKGRIWTKAEVNVALHDLQAKALGVPVTDLLGGRLNDTIPVIGPVIGIMPPDDMAKQAAEEAAAGFGAIKIKIGETREADIARVAAVREAIDDGVMLRVDANDHYQPADAIALIRALEKYDLEHVEQPVSRGDLLGMAEVRRNVGVPIMTDDTVATPQDAMNVIRLGAAD
jgi:muconate cycloisomerase